MSDENVKTEQELIDELKANIRDYQSLVMKQYFVYIRLYERKEAFRKASDEVSTLSGLDPDTFWTVYNRTITEFASRAGAEKRNGTKPYSDSDVRGLAVPRYKKEHEDPFALDNYIHAIAEQVAFMKPGEVGSLEFEQAVDAKKVAKLLPKVSRYLKWKKYLAKVEKNILYIKLLS